MEADRSIVDVGQRTFTTAFMPASFRPEQSRFPAMRSSTPKAHSACRTWRLSKLQDDTVVEVTAARATPAVDDSIDQHDRQRQRSSPVQFTLQVDRKGNGVWTDLDTVDVARKRLRRQALAERSRCCLAATEDQIATAWRPPFCIKRPPIMSTATQPRIQKLCSRAWPMSSDANALGSVVYAPNEIANLRVITGDDRYFDFTKADFEFEADKPTRSWQTLLHVEPEFTVDDASVILKYQGQTYCDFPKAMPHSTSHSHPVGRERLAKSNPNVISPTSTARSTKCR